MIYNMFMFGILITLLVLTGMGACALILKILKNK